MHALQVILLIAAAQLALWSFIFMRLRRQAEQIVEQARQSGEDLIIPPVKASYQGWTKRFGTAKSMGRIALTDRRIIFKRPFGRDIIILLDEIADVSDTVRLGWTGHSFGNNLSLRLRSGEEVVFMVDDQSRWVRESGQWLASLRMSRGIRP